MKVAIVGSRGFTPGELKVVTAFLHEKLTPQTEVVTGGAIGVDSVAMTLAKMLGLKMIVFYPNWKLHGKKAGYLRNLAIIDEADVVMAFWDGTSKGTQHAIKTAVEYGKILQVYTVVKNEVKAVDVEEFKKE